MYDDPQFDVNRHKSAFKRCAECTTPEGCAKRMQCGLFETREARPAHLRELAAMPVPNLFLTRKEVRAKQPDWRDVPTATYRFGAIELPFVKEFFPNSRWFKTKKAALTYARISFQKFAIADYWER